MKIKILKEKVINQIAAGEVVENPASVVKELLENAIDAGAKKIAVEIRGGGFQLIRISDDGEGMAADDALLCFERHGTSKIREAKDIHALRSMGFRGEALASICSISKMRLSTSCGEGAVEVLVEGGKIIQSSAAARSRGTTFEVRSLFFNTPARKRFQKSATSAQTEVTKMMTKIALAYPKICFTLQAGEKILFQVKEGDLRQRIVALLGKEFMEGTREVAVEGLRGFLGSTIAARTNRSGQYLYLNNRVVQCLPVSWAIEEGYGTRLPTRRYPTFVLFLDLPTDEIDVNVHPQKKEVRLQQEERVRAFVRQVVVEVFAPQKSYVQPVAQPSEFSLNFPPAFPTKLEEKDAEIFLLQPFLTSFGLFGHHYFAKKGERLYLFDLSKSLETLYFEKAIGSHTEVPRMQMLLPQRLDFAPHEAEKISQNIALFEGLGIGIRPFGESSFIVDSLCDFIEEGQVRAVLEDWLEDRQVSLDPKRTFAQKIARAAKRRKTFSVHEAHEIAEKILKEYPGAPVYKTLKEEDLEKLIANQKIPACTI